MTSSAVVAAQPRWKMIYLAKRNPALAAGDAAPVWPAHTAPGAQHCTRVRSDGAEDGGLHGASADYDGVQLLPLRDLEAAASIQNSAEALVCGEQVLLDAPPSAVVVFGFLRRNATVSKSAFDAAWIDGPKEAWLSSPTLKTAVRVVHNHVVQTPPEGGESTEFDGVAEWWFDSAAAARAAFADSRSGASAAGATHGVVDMRSAVRDLRCQLPAPYSVLVDLKQSVFVLMQAA